MQSHVKDACRAAYQSRSHAAASYLPRALPGEIANAIARTAVWHHEKKQTTGTMQGLARVMVCIAASCRQFSSSFRLTLRQRANDIEQINQIDLETTNARVATSPAFAWHLGSSACRRCACGPPSRRRDCADTRAQNRRSVAHRGVSAGRSAAVPPRARSRRGKNNGRESSRGLAQSAGAARDANLLCRASWRAGRASVGASVHRSSASRRPRARDGRPASAP